MVEEGEVGGGEAGEGSTSANEGQSSQANEIREEQGDFHNLILLQRHPKPSFRRSCSHDASWSGVESSHNADRDDAPGPNLRSQGEDERDKFERDKEGGGE